MNTAEPTETAQMTTPGPPESRYADGSIRPDRWAPKTAPENPKSGQHLPPDRKSDLFRALTAQKRHQIAGLIANGSSIRNAARMVELLPDTVERAIARGRSDLKQMEDALEQACATTDETTYYEPVLTVAAEFALKVGKAQATFALNTHEKFRKAMTDDARCAMAYLELLGRLQPEDYGRRQVVKVDNDTTVRVIFLEKDGEEWQRGQSRVTRTDREPLALEAAPAAQIAGSDIIDSHIRELTASDDNDF